MDSALATVRWFGILTGALSLFYLSHAWLELGLLEVFHRIYAWYAGILHPLVGLLKPIAQLLVGWLGWTLPVWWKDVTILYLTIGAATGRTVSAQVIRHKLLESTYREEKEEDGEIPDDRTIRSIRGDLRKIQAVDILLLPIKILAWPVVWIASLVVRIVDGSRPYPHSLTLRSTVHGYAASAARELAKIVVGALIFAGLNAGLA